MRRFVRERKNPCVWNVLGASVAGLGRLLKGMPEMTGGRCGCWDNC